MALAAALIIIILPLVCYAQGGGGSTPSIAAVRDAGGYTADIADGSIFVVFGTNLCGPGVVSGTLPYSSTLNGVKVTFTPTGGGAPTEAYMVYTYLVGTTNQLAGILPSTVAAGNYNVTVTNNGSVSAAFKSNVVAHKFGIITVNGSGGGRAVVQNYISQTQYDLDRYTTGTLGGGYTYSPAHPGQIIVIWGTGLGAVAVPDNNPPGAIDLRGDLNVKVLIDGVPISPDLYAGRAPLYPGEDEILLTLPSAISTGCQLSLQVSINGQLSNSTTISVASGSDNACTAPGITTAQLAKLDQGGSFNVGTMSIAGGVDVSGTTSIRVDAASAIFVSLNPDQLNAAPQASPTVVPNNSCVVTRQIVTVPTTGSQTPSFKLLGAGNVVLNGPNLSNTPISIETLLNGKVNGVTVVNGAVLAAGTYTVTGAGGKDVGPFQASIQMSQPLSVSGTLPSTISRGQDFVISWTGGGTDQVTITGSSSIAAPGSTPTNPILDSGVFTCVTTGDKGTFTVPASILQQLPAAKGNLNISSNNRMTTFTAPLVAGGNLDYGYFSTGFQNRLRVAYN